MQNYIGKTKEIKLPSGFNVTIREQNGNDDDVISNMADAQSGKVIAKFLSGIIVENPFNKILSPEEVMGWKVNDAYYLLLSSRIHSLGESLEIEVTCQNQSCNRKSPYTEDLNNFILGKYSDENPYAVTPYSNGDTFMGEFTLTSGKIIKLDYLTLSGENMYLKYTDEQMSKNKELLVRNLQLKLEDGSYMPIGNFGIFSGREMAEIRKIKADREKVFEPIAECICPHCKTKNLVSIIREPAFFYPLSQ